MSGGLRLDPFDLIKTYNLPGLGGNYEFTSGRHTQAAAPRANHAACGLSPVIWSGGIDEAIGVAWRMKGSAMCVICHFEDGNRLPFSDVKNYGQGTGNKIHKLTSYGRNKSICIKLGRRAGP